MYMYVCMVIVVVVAHKKINFFTLHTPPNQPSEESTEEGAIWVMGLYTIWFGIKKNGKKQEKKNQEPGVEVLWAVKNNNRSRSIGAQVDGKTLE